MKMKELNANEKKVLKRIGENIKASRLKNGLSQEALAYESGLDRAYVGRVERGEKNISILSLLKISTVLKIEIGNLIKD